MGAINHSTLNTAAGLHLCRPRGNAGSPAGVITPTHVYELLLDTTNGHLYVAEGATSADWTQVSMPAREIGTVSGGVSWSFGAAASPIELVWGGLASSEVIGDGFSQAAASHDGYAFALTGRSTNSRGYASVGFATEEQTGDTNKPTFDWYVKLPPEFTGWEEAGIRVLYDFSRETGADALDVTLEAMDPADFLAWSTPKIATDNYTGAQTPGSPTWIQLTGTVLSTDYSAGDVLLLRFRWSDPDAGATSGEFQVLVAQVEFHWTDQ